MNSLTRSLRTFLHGRKFAKKGKHCRFPGQVLDIDGHVEIGDNCRFRNNVIMRTKGDAKIVFGTYSGASYYCMFEATKYIKVGNFTGIAEFSVLRDTNHMVFGTDDHWRLTPHIAEPIVVGDCVAILSRAYIGPGVAIGDGAIIAPNSYVTKDVPPYEVWGGNPARRMGHRTKGMLAESMKKQYGELLASYGLKEERYGYSEEQIKEAARAGVNRAAEERDRLKAELAAESGGTDHDLDD
jgi:acetyltransferase-like isoleucine patch superfamily enzyme